MSALTAAAEQMRAGIDAMARAIGGHAEEVRQANQANQHAESAMLASRDASQGLVDATRQLGSMMSELNRSGGAYRGHGASDQRHRRSDQSAGLERGD